MTTKPFEEWGLQDATSAIGTPTAALVANRAYVQGDHWQSGLGWTGPILLSGSTADTEFLARLRKIFVSQGVLAEAVGRHVGGVIGKEPSWDLVPRDALPKPEEQDAGEQVQASGLEALAEEADDALTAWWDKRKIHKLLKRAARALLYVADDEGEARVLLRLYVPRGLLTMREDGTAEVPAQATLADALNLIHLSVPEPEMGAVAVDDDTLAEIGVYAYQHEKGNRAELSFIGEDGLTVLKLLGNEQPLVARLELGGRLLHHQMERPAFLSPQARSLQALLDKTWTMMSRNLDAAGFVQRFFLDAMPPGEWSTDAQGDPVFTPAASISMGPGTTNFIAPSQVRGKDGETRFGSPEHVREEPVSVATFTESIDAIRHALMEELDQLHTLIAGDAAASGRSRVQALADFLLSLAETAGALEEAMRWLLETALALASVFMQTPGRYEGLRAEASCRLDIGPVDPETMAAVQRLVGDKPLMSQETGMARIGIDDPAAEMQRMEEERARFMPPLERAQLERIRANTELDRLVGQPPVPGANPATRQEIEDLAAQSGGAL